MEQLEWKYSAFQRKDGAMKQRTEAEAEWGIIHFFSLRLIWMI